VETLTRPPQTPVRPRSIAEAPRRWLKVLLGVATALILVLVSGALSWVTNVEPFARGSLAYGISDPSVHVVRRNVDALGVSGSVQTVEMRRGMRFAYRFSIRNAADVPVTIVDVGTHDGNGDIVVRPLRANTEPLIDQRLTGGFGPFEPFQLAPGAEAAIAVEVHVGADACYASNTFAGIWELPVTYRIFGVTRHSWVDTGTEVRLAGNRETTC
jgi:hypothetical protein